MPLLHAVILALVQGLTEFLPISSSAHLVLAPWLMGWEDQGLAFDVVVHLGTLAAVCGYFRADLLAVASGWLRGVTGRGTGGDADARLGWLIILATIPVGLAGLLFKDWVETVARNPVLIGVTSIAFGLLLWVADHWGGLGRGADRIGWRDAVAVGLAQAAALVPGVSRSGITITAGRAMGLDRQAAARFSFLLAVPVIALSGVLEIGDLIRTGTGGALLGPLVTGFAVAAASAYLCIKFFLRFLERHSMDVFVAYRVVIGILILVAAT